MDIQASRSGKRAICPSIKGRLVSKSPVLQGLEILGIGVVSAAIGYALGGIIPRLLGG